MIAYLFLLYKNKLLIAFVIDDKSFCDSRFHIYSVILFSLLC